MQTWSAKVKDGTVMKDITVVGKNEAEARKQAGHEGTVISLKQQNKSRFGRGMSRGERYIFLMRLATMTGSRFPATQALKLMIDSFGGKIREAAKNALPLLTSGHTLGDALCADTKNFPGSIGLLIKSGSASGDTPGALREAAEFERLIGDASKSAIMSIAQAFAYMFLALFMLLGTQYIMIPKMFDSPIMKMAKHIDIGIWVSLSFWTMVLTIVLITGLVGLLLLATLGRQIAPDKADDIILKIPFMRDLVISQDNYVGLYRLSLLVKANIPMREALLSCADSTRPGALREDFRRAWSGMLRGEKWAKFMKTLHPTDRAALMLMPDNDELAKNLHMIADGAKSLYLARLGVIAPSMTLLAAGLISVAGFVILIVTTVPQLQLVQELMG